METDKNQFMPVSEEVRRVLLVPGLGIAAIAGAIAITLSSSQNEEVFFRLFRYQDLPGAVAYAIMILGAVSLTRSVNHERLETLVEVLGRKTPWIAAATVIGLSIATVTIYHNLPLALDEYSQSFQAKIFAAGRLWVDYSRTFVHYMIYGDFVDSFFRAETGRVVTGYWPGFSLLLAPFMALELPWLLNPLLAAGTLFLLRHLAQQLLPGTAAGGWAVLLALASPQFTVTAISYYSMNAHLFLNLLFVALVLKPSVKRLILAGLVGSFALVLHQPLPHLAFAIPWIGWLALAPEAEMRSSLGRIKRLLLLGLGYLPLSLFLGVGWKLLQRAVLHPANESLTEASGQVVSSFVLGALANLGFFALPSMDLFVYRGIEYLKLFLWAVPGLPILAALGWWRNRQLTGLRLLGWSAASSCLAFLLVPFSQGHGWGDRYFHQAWGTLPLLAAAILVSPGPSRASWIRVMGVMAVLSLVTGTALRFYQVHDFIGTQLAQMPPTLEGEHQICFIATDSGFYRQDLVQNDPWLRDPRVTLLSSGRQRDAALVRHIDPGAKRIYDNGLDTVWLVEPSPEFWTLGGVPILGR